MPLAIRSARAGDVAELSRLMVRAIRHNNAVEYPPDVVELILAWHTVQNVEAMIASRRVFLAQEGERIVGTIALQADVLRGLFVDVDRQGLGYARTLVRWVEALALRDGHAVLSLRSSITAHSFYERLGYRTQSFGFHREGSTYLMVKRLKL